MVWYFILFLLTGSALAADKPPVLLDAPILTVDQNGNASAIILLRNDTGTEISRLHLNLSDFTHKGPDGKSYPLGTDHTLAALNDEDKEIFDGKNVLPANATLNVRVTVTKLWEAGQSEALLKNGDMPIPRLGGPSESYLKAIRIPAVYNVQILSSTPDAPEIHFVRGRFFGTRDTSALIGLKNADPFTYRFAWRLRLNGQLFDGGNNFIDLPPGGTTHVSLTQSSLTADFLKPGLITAGTLKDEILKGTLILEPMFEGDAVTRPLPAKDLAVTFRLSYWRKNFQQFCNIVGIFLVLALGGVLSIWVHSGMPNTTRALALRRRINALETRIRGLGVSIDSRWRVLLESHLPALRRELFATPWVFPAFATTLDGLTKKVDMVQQWVDITYSASIVLHQADQDMHLIPPTILRWIQERCTHALTPIESGFTTDAEIAAMQATLDTARNYLTVIMTRVQHAELDQEITDRETRLQPALNALAAAQPQFASLVNQVAATIGTPLTPVNYIERDMRSLKVDLLQIFDQRTNQFAGAPAGSPAADALARLQTYGSRFMTYLVPDTHESLRTALLLVNEMRQDIYPEALIDQVTQGAPAVVITTDPAPVHAQSPVRLGLCFNRQLLNEAAARQEWTCTWDFGDNTTPEDGWEVFHSYELPDTRQVQVTIRDLDANPVVTSAPITRHVIVRAGPEQSALRRGWYFMSPEPETRLELVRLAIVLALALFGLMTTAQQQAQNLSFLEAVGAVVALGFGADTIKNLIVQRSSSS